MRTTLPTRLVALGVGLATSLTVGLATSGTAEAKSAPSGGDVSSATPTLSAEATAAGKAKFGQGATANQTLEAYWTPERMRAAKPADSAVSYQAAEKAYATNEAKARAAGTAKKTNDGPARSTDGATSKVFTVTKTSPSSFTAAYNPNAPTYDPTAYTQGKVFFSKPDGNYVCSGTIINSEGKDTVWTAGHCVHGGSGGTWHTNWTFVPAYDDDLANPRPYGTWSANQLWSRTAWTNSSDFSQDIGVAIMNTNWGWHIVDYFGGQGLTVNRGKSGVLEYAFGYPAEWPFDGGNLMGCVGWTSPEWDAWLFWSQTDKISCDMTRGSSGGAWLTDYDGNWGRLNGVNSRIDRIVGPTIMLSPYFDDDAWSLYNSTRYL